MVSSPTFWLVCLDARSVLTMMLTGVYWLQPGKKRLDGDIDMEEDEE